MILQKERLLPTPPELWPAEDELRAALNGSSVFWCGRAATALLWAYEIARLVGDSVDIPEAIVPAISCLTPANAASLAGYRVRFADVDPQTGLVTLDTVRERWTPATRAVVFVDLFGQTADLNPLAAWCRENNLLLIEDVAQAQGARLPGGLPAGSGGEVAVFSFNPTKILECGGGALVARSARVREALDCSPISLPVSEIDSQSAVLLSESAGKLHRALVALRRIEAAPNIAAAYLRLQAAYCGLYLRSLHRPVKLASAWASLPRLIEARARRAEVYASRLSGGPWRLLDGWRSSGVCWRYSLLVDFPEHLMSLSEAVRRDGFHVSNLYWPVNEFINPLDHCPHAEYFARRIVNLWTEEAVSVDWVEKCCSSVAAHALRYSRTV